MNKRLRTKLYFSYFMLIITLFFGIFVFLFSVDGSQSNIRITCNLSDFDGFPKLVTGRLVMQSKNTYILEVENNSRKDAIGIIVKKNRCK